MRVIDWKMVVNDKRFSVKRLFRLNKYILVAGAGVVIMKSGFVGGKFPVRIPLVHTFYLLEKNVNSMFQPLSTTPNWLL